MEGDDIQTAVCGMFDKIIIDAFKQPEPTTVVARSYNAKSEMTIQHVQVTDGWSDHQIPKH